MDILIVSPFFPLPLKSGGQTRLFNLIKHHSSRHNIDFISLIREEEKQWIPDLSKFCRKVVTFNINEYVREKKRDILRGKNLSRSFVRLLRLAKGMPLDISGFYFREMQEKLNALLSSNRYDVVQVELTRMATYCDDLFYKNNSSLKVLVDYDLDFFPRLRGYQCSKKLIDKLVRYADYKMHQSFALKTWPLFDNFVVMSEVDKNKALEFLPDLSVSVVPNGVDLAYFRPVPREEKEKRLLFIGGTLHSPNIDALQFFSTEIFPGLKQRMENLSTTVIGEGWDAYKDQLLFDDTVRFTGYVDDIRTYVTDQTVMIAPIRIGGGTRLKILEAMAMGIPVVSTAVGSEGISVEDGVNILLADTPDTFVRKIEKIFSDNQLYRTLAENAQALVRENYGWDKLALKMEEIYHASDNK